MGNTIEDAARLVGIGIRTAYRWKREGRPGVAGRRANSTEVLIRARALKKIAKESRRVGQRQIPLYPTAPRIAARYRHLYGVKMHPTTCIRLLARVNCRSYVRPRHPNLKNSELRYKFAREWCNRSPNPGGFRLNAKSYVRRCLSTVSGYLSSHNALFMHDGARSHTANSTKAYLQRKGIRCLLNFPAHSPDMNPIESIWALLDAKIAEKLTEQTDAALMAATKAAWEELDQGVINAYVMSFRSKCRRVAASKGI